MFHCAEFMRIFLSIISAFFCARCCPIAQSTKTTLRSRGMSLPVTGCSLRAFAGENNRQPATNKPLVRRSQIREGIQECLVIGIHVVIRQAGVAGAFRASEDKQQFY